MSAPRSFSLTLGSEEIPSLSGLAYQLGVSYRAGGKGDPRDEKAVALALTQRFELDGHRAIELLAEGAYIANAGGSLDSNTYLTAVAAYLHGPWNLSLAGAVRRIDVDAASDTNDRMSQISAGYSFESGFGVDVGWRYGREGGARTRTLGALLSYVIEF